MIIAETAVEISVDIELAGDVRAWRPKSVHSYFGEGREKLFAWPLGAPRAGKRPLQIGKEEHRASGSGYHDRNCGDVPMQTLMHNWYWARASVGPYTVIASYITATAAYGYETQIVYMLAKDGKIIADDDAKVSFETDRVAIDRKIGKPVADVTRYTFRDADTAMITHAPSNQNGIGRVPQHCWNRHERLAQTATREAWPKPSCLSKLPF